MKEDMNFCPRAKKALNDQSRRVDDLLSERDALRSGKDTTSLSAAFAQITYLQKELSEERRTRRAAQKCVEVQREMNAATFWLGAGACSPANKENKKLLARIARRDVKIQKLQASSNDWKQRYKSAINKFRELEILRLQ